MWTSLFLVSAALADCDAWDAGFTARRLNGASSRALFYRWTAPPACGNFSFSHYLVCRRDGAIGTRPAIPQRPDEPDLTCAISIPDVARTRAIDDVYKSHHAWSTRIFACGDAACSTWYGEDGTSRRTSSAVTTAKERWVIPDVDGFTDDDRMIADHEASAATGFFYPDMFPEAGAFAVWWSTGQGGRQNIRYQVSRATGWRPWNDNGASFHSPVRVADSADNAGRFGWVTHPWAVPAVDGGVPYVRMYLQADDDGNPNSGESYEVWSMDSADASGVDFSLACAAGPCPADVGTCQTGALCDWEDESEDGGAASLEIAADGRAFSAFLSSASHGTLVFDPADDDGAVDFSAEAPALLFTGAAGACDAQPDDLYLAPWNGVDWTVSLGDDQCPDALRSDAHDPSVLRLPDGTAKVYMQVGPDSYEVCHLDGALTDCVPIELAFDDGTTMGVADEGIGGCSDNFQVFSLDDGGRTPRVGAMLHVMGNGAECFAARKGGIVTLELRN